MSLSQRDEKDDRDERDGYAGLRENRPIGIMMKVHRCDADWTCPVSGNNNRAKFWR